VLLAGLTLLPALLVVLGPKAFWPRLPRSEARAAGRTWLRIGTGVRRRPWPWLALGALLLGGFALALSGYRSHTNIVGQFQGDVDSTRGYKVVRASFPAGATAPLTVLVERTDGPVRPADVQQVSDRLRATPGVLSVLDALGRSRDGRVAGLTVTFADNPFGDPALERVERIRRDLAAAGPGLRVLVGQGSGERLDYRTAALRDLKVLVPLVLLVVFVTLVLLLRALVAPLFLLATVVLSYLGTLGASLLIFEHVTGQDGIDPSVLVIVFIFLVALGSDYNIFLMSRVREEALEHGTSEGMLRALVETGPVITSAGLILAGTFAVLAVLPVWALFDVGFAVALGVLLDTFLVRSIVVPAITWILGDRAWWPSTVEAGRRSPLVTAVYTAEDMLRVRRELERYGTRTSRS
jgi:putative drug exporter of the RND superfamily